MVFYQTCPSAQEPYLMQPYYVPFSEPWSPYKSWGGTPLYKLYSYEPPHRVGFWSENRYILWPFWFGIRYGFRGYYGSVWTYLLFQFQKSKKEVEKCEFEMHLTNFFLCTLNLSNDDVIFAYRPGQEPITQVWKQVWILEVWSENRSVKWHIFGLK